MTLQIYAPHRLERRVQTPHFSVHGIDLHDVAGDRSPVTMLDEFQVAGRSFPPHPHAGFSAVTYVLPESPGGVRSRDSLGNDLRIGPGGIVWTEAGSGLLHHEVPADGTRVLHGLQFFVNASARTKLNPPRVLWLEGADVPVLRESDVGIVRIVVGSYGSMSSPVTPTDPFTLLDVELSSSMTVPVEEGQFGTVYVRAGAVHLHSAGTPQTVAAGQVATFEGGPGSLSIEARSPARVLIFLGREIRDPVVVDGPFIMNRPEQIRAALVRYHNGEMGHLSPTAE